ncbi:bifunctional DNA primase/polymerase [Kitasatospora sp. NPDC059646]|uniref:bifunctional DNA primase/polymerase n=1 Tax=Kitasatospora sp. NPDC059646 TaxID=3346893 RepID=UPI00369A975F
MPASSPTSAVPVRPAALAHWCARRGWPVHPLTPGGKIPAANCNACAARGHTADGCPCLRAGRWCHGFRAATTDPATVTAWWTANPAFGVGIACGPAGLVVIDVDAHATTVPDRSKLLPGIDIPDSVDLRGLTNGFHTIALLAALRGHPSPADDTGTLRVRTPSGGTHIWYQAHPHLAVRSSSGSGKTRALAWQVDVRAHGGYIIAPGTRTTAGTYTALGETRNPAPLPGWLAAELLRTHHADQPSTAAPAAPPPRARQAVSAHAGAHGVPRVLATLLDDVRDCAAAPEGTGFSEKLNRAAFAAGGLAAAGLLTEDRAEELLKSAAHNARPHQERRTESIIRSALAAGARRPLHPRGRS